MDRVGLIIPSSNVVIEDLSQAPSRLARQDLRFHVEPAASSAATLFDSVALTFEELPF